MSGYGRDLVSTGRLGASRPATTGAAVVEVEVQRQLGDGDVLKIVTAGQVTDSDVLEFHRLAAQMKRYAVERGLRVVEIRLGPAAAFEDGA